MLERKERIEEEERREKRREREKRKIRERVRIEEEREHIRSEIASRRSESREYSDFMRFKKRRLLMKWHLT